MSGSQPRTEALLHLRTRHVPQGVANTHPLFVAQAQGAQLFDIDGKAYVDFAGGIGVLNVGHSHPRAVQAQLERFTHTCFQVAMYESYTRLAERLNALAPGDFPKKTLFLTTGAEAVENAVKIARAATKRPAVIAFTHSFHGRTLLGMSLTGKATAYKQHFGPFAPEVYHAPYPYEYRGWTSERALEALQDLFRAQVTPDQVAAILIEPVPDLVDQVITEAREQGLILLKAGLYGNVLRILVPLVIEESLLSRSLDTLCAIITLVAARGHKSTA